MLLCEKYRPARWDEVIGQDAIRAKVDAIRPRGLSGRSYFLSGGSGQGKTTIARILAREVSDDWGILEWKSPAELTADVLRWVDEQCRFRPMGRGLCFILNECHALRASQIVTLLGLTEQPGQPAWVTWIFTTTKLGEAKLFDDLDDAGPLLSRCIRLNLAQRDLAKPFADHIVRLAREAGLLNGKGDPYYVARATRLLKDKRNNLRAALNEVETGYLTASDEH